MEKILIIEDEQPIRELINLNLSVVGYETYEAADGVEGLKHLNDREIDLVILDLMLPKIDGYDLLPAILKKKVPVILVTAKDGIKDKIRGLNMGADDYITKPFDVLELLARIKAVLRRSGKEIRTKNFADVEIFYEQRKVFKAGVEIELTPKEYDLLKILADNQGIAMSRDKLLELVWDYDYDGNSRTVDIHIQRLRNKLKTDKIKTIYKLGYRLED